MPSQPAGSEVVPTSSCLDVCGLLSGIAFSPDTIGDLRNALFGERTLTEEAAEKEAQNAEGTGGGEPETENLGPKKLLLSKYCRNGTKNGSMLQYEFLSEPWY